MSSLPDFFGIESQALRSVFISRYVSLTGYSVLLFDLVLTLPHEISVVWPANWSIVKILFLLLRYTVPPLVTTDIVGLLGLTPLNKSYCQAMSQVLAYYQVTALALFNVIISLRLHALYNRRLAIGLSLAGLFVISYAGAIVLSTHFFGQTVYPTVNYLPIPQFQICYAKTWGNVYTVWIPSTLFETLLWCLTAYKTWEHWRVKRLPLGAALAGDGFLYHTAALAARLCVLLLLRFSNNIALMLFGVNFSFSVVTIVGSRMMLYLPSVQSVQHWSQESAAIHDDSEGEWGISEVPVLPGAGMAGLRGSRAKPDIWLANQGGRSFMEQLYETTMGGSAEPPRPTVLFMDRFTAGNK